MKAYCNVATEPQRKVAAKSGKAYYEFRAAESMKGDSDTTWYTVRLFRDEDPRVKKGDFVCVTGKLKNDVFIARDGKPMGIMTLLAFSLTRIDKDGKREALLTAPSAEPGVPQATAQRPAVEPDTEADNPWLALV